MRRRSTPKDSLPWLLTKLGIAVVVVAAFPLVIIPWHEQQRALEWQAYEAQQQAQQAALLQPFKAAFAGGDRIAVLELCKSEFDASYYYPRPAQALAWSEDRVEAFVYVSAAQYGLRRLTCAADGITQGRIDHPLAALVPVEEGSLADPDSESPWSRLEREVALAPPDLRSIEIVVRPDNGALLQRRVRRGADGWQIDVDPPDAPAFPLLSTSPTLLATQAEGAADPASSLPPAAKEYPQRRWSSATTEAFEFLERELPEDARSRIVGLRFDDDEIEIGVAAPVAGLDAPYGDIDFDPWGAAVNWLYPRDEPPGFGCPVGVPLEQLRLSFLARCGELPGCNPRTHFSIADYSCSQSSGGRWNLHIQSAN